MVVDVQRRGLHFLFALEGYMNSFGSAREFSCVTQSKSNENYGAIDPFIEIPVYA